MLCELSPWKPAAPRTHGMVMLSSGSTCTRTATLVAIEGGANNSRRLTVALAVSEPQGGQENR